MKAIVTLKNYTCAFLENDGEFLLMKSAPNREVNPNFWSGVGGKIEAEEINAPYDSCLREIYEETNISPNDIQNLVLRYIILRRHNDTIRQSYIYFGNTKIKNVIDTDEGKLHWVPSTEILKKRFTSTFFEMLKHYSSPCSDDKNIFVGTAENKDGRLQMCWSKIEDFVE